MEKKKRSKFFHRNLNYTYSKSVSTLSASSLFLSLCLFQLTLEMIFASKMVVSSIKPKGDKRRKEGRFCRASRLVQTALPPSFHPPVHLFLALTFCSPHFPLSHCLPVLLSLCLSVCLSPPLDAAMPRREEKEETRPHCRRRADAGGGEK